jgi:hypothetical protein
MMVYLDTSVVLAEMFAEDRIDFLRRRRVKIALASNDQRLCRAASVLGWTLHPSEQAGAL